MDMFDVLSGEQNPKVTRKPWMDEKQFILVNNQQDGIGVLHDLVDECIKSKVYAIDLEATSLDTRVFSGNKTETSIVGVCISPDGIRGYYIPVMHRKSGKPGEMSECNIPMHDLRRELKRLIDAPDTTAIFHNSKYDQELLQFNGGEPLGQWDAPKSFDDTLILAYLDDTRRKRIGLKHLSKELLGMEMIEIEELFHEVIGKGYSGPMDFSLLDPLTCDAVTWYGASDAICTYLLREKLLPGVMKDQARVYSIEKACIAATRWMERNRIHVDKPKVAHLIQLGQKEMFEAMKEVYDMASQRLGRNITPMHFVMAAKEIQKNNPEFSITAGASGERLGLGKLLKDCQAKAHIPLIISQDPELTALSNRTTLTKKNLEGTTVTYPVEYDIMSASQLGLLLDELAIPGLQRTEKSGQIKTSKDEIDKVLEKAGSKYPWTAKVVRFRETQKALATYLLPLWEDSHPSDDTIKINFNGHKVDTGRFSTPGSSDPKADGGTRYFMQGTPATYDPGRPECLLRVRECLSARPAKPGEPEKFYAAVDFAGVELRIVTNMSKEPLWLKEFFHCSGCDMTFDQSQKPPRICPRCGSDKIGDLHTLTAINIYGADARKRSDWKQLRGQAKCVHPDTLVWTQNGLSRIGSLITAKPDQFAPCQHDTQVMGQRNLIPVLETYNGGNKDLFHVVTRRGLVTCSDQHQFLMADGTLRSISSGLQKGQRLAECIPAVTLPEGSFPLVPYHPADDVPEVYTQTTPELAYWSGLFLGDGCKVEDTCLAFAHGDVEKIDHYGEPYLTWQDSLVESSIAVGFRPVRKKETVYLGSRSVMRYASALSLVDGVGGPRILRIPDWVFQAGRKGLMPFLAGLIDTDGYVGKRDSNIRWCTKDPVFAGQVAAALNAMGFTPGVYLSWNKTYQRDYYIVSVLGSEASLFYEYMRHKGKRNLLCNCKKHNHSPNQVIKIFPAGNVPCVDLHIDDASHIYWTNGLPTHNSLNFALCYGGGGAAVMRTVNVDKNEGWRIKREYDKTYKHLEMWWTRMKSFALKHGYVQTAFGRKYPVPDIQLPKIDPETGKNNGAFISKAERNATNGPIQGSSADITKLGMVFVYTECKRRKWLNKCRMIITMHDELVFEIDGDILEEAIEMICTQMTENKMVKNLGWQVPLLVDVELGKDWTVPWDLGALQRGEWRFIGDTKYKKPESLPAGYTWDALSAWPESLRPYFKAAREETTQAEPPQVVDAPVADAIPQEISTPVPVPANPVKKIPDSGKKKVIEDGRVVYEYIVQPPYNMGKIEAMAQAIHAASGSGASELVLKSVTGEDVTPTGRVIYVSGMAFEWALKSRGLS